MKGFLSKDTIHRESKNLPAKPNNGTSACYLEIAEDSAYFKPENMYPFFYLRKRYPDSLDRHSFSPSYLPTSDQHEMPQTDSEEIPQK